MEHGSRAFTRVATNQSTQAEQSVHTVHVFFKGRGKGGPHPRRPPAPEQVLAAAAQRASPASAAALGASSAAGLNAPQAKNRGEAEPHFLFLSSRVRRAKLRICRTLWRASIFWETKHPLGLGVWAYLTCCTLKQNGFKRQIPTLGLSSRTGYLLVCRLRAAAESIWDTKGQL